MGELIRNQILTEGGFPIVRLKQIAPNFTRINIGETVLYFSYETLVAFEVDGRIYATQEKYSRTTSKHINLLNVDEYIPAEEWEQFTKKKLGNLVE